MLLGVKRWVQDQIASKMVYPAAPFLPRLEGSYVTDAGVNIAALKHYLDGLSVRQLAHQVVATFGGKVPHATGLVPGGLTQNVTATNIAYARSVIQKIRTFVEECFVPDVITVAGAFRDYFSIGRTSGDFMSYGVFDSPDGPGKRLFAPGVLLDGQLQALDTGKIAEQVRYSFFSSQSNLHPSEGSTVPAPEAKSDAYSWLKAPRYAGRAVEVGPVARVLISYKTNNYPELNSLVDAVAAKAGITLDAMNSVLGRHACRAIEAKLLADKCLEWIDELKPGEPTVTPLTIPDSGAGAGLWEAPRGALGHWIEIHNKRISNYQCVVPSTWNCSPRDDNNVAGPVETSLEGTVVADPDNPLEVARIVRSFDPCLACAVH